MSANNSNENKAAEQPAQAEQPKAAATGDAKNWSEQVKKFALAAVGAVHLTPEDVKTFTKQLVEKGELAKKDGERLIKQFADKVQATVKRDGKAVAAKAEEAAQTVADKAGAAASAFNQENLTEKINSSIERMLHSMNIATRKDLAELGKQLDELDGKVEQLVEAATAAGRQGGARKSTAPTGAGATS